MNKFFCILIFTSYVIALSIYAEEAPVFNTIDAFSSASIYHSLKIDSGKIFRDRAELYWKERYDVYKVLAYYVTWGTEEGVFSDTLNLFDSLRIRSDSIIVTKLITLHNLNDSTKYYGRFLRDYNGALDTTDFRFNTPPLPSGVRKSPVFFQHNNTEKISGLELFTISGQRILQTSYDRGINSSESIRRNLPSGVFLVRYIGKSGIIRTDKIMIGK